MHKVLGIMMLAVLPAMADDAFADIATRSRVDLTLPNGVCSAAVVRNEPDRLLLKLSSQGVCGNARQLVSLPRANIQSIFRNKPPLAGLLLRPVAAGTAL